MSSLLNLLKSKGSVLTTEDGKTPKSYDGVSQYQKDLEVSTLDLNGKTPLQYDKQTIQVAGLEKSQLDLNGKTPEKYLDNLPK